MGIKKACLSKCANIYYTSFYWSRATMCFSFLNEWKNYITHRLSLSKNIFRWSKTVIKPVKMTSEMSQNQVVSTSLTTTFKHCQRRSTQQNQIMLSGHLEIQLHLIVIMDMEKASKRLLKMLWKLFHRILSISLTTKFS